MACAELVQSRSAYAGDPGHLSQTHSCLERLRQQPGNTVEFKVSPVDGARRLHLAQVQPPYECTPLPRDL